MAWTMALLDNVALGCDKSKARFNFCADCTVSFAVDGLHHYCHFANTVVSIELNEAAAIFFYALMLI